MKKNVNRYTDDFIFKGSLKFLNTDAGRVSLN
jgi:hypothetical protein